MKSVGDDPALQAYRSAKLRIEQILTTARHAIKSMEHSPEFDRAEIGDLSDAESEFFGGMHQIIGNLDEISKSDPLRSYNIAVGVIFSLRGYLELGSILKPSATTIKFAKRQQQKRATEGANIARSSRKISPSDQIIETTIRDRLEAWKADGRKITTAAMQKEVETALSNAGIDRTVSDATIWRRMKNVFKT